MQYYLTLPKGLITVRNGMFKGSNTVAVWSPCNPSDNGGWQNGDTLIVTCSFNLNPTNLQTMPASTEYAGLCAGACNADDQNGITALITQAKNIYVPTPGQLLGTGITTNATPAANTIFYNAQAVKGNFILQPTTRGKLTNYIYQWIMTYNGSNTVSNGSTTEIVFGYGDPMNSESDS